MTKNVMVTWIHEADMTSVCSQSCSSVFAVVTLVGSIATFTTAGQNWRDTPTNTSTAPPDVRLRNLFSSSEVRLRLWGQKNSGAVSQTHLLTGVLTPPLTCLHNLRYRTFLHPGLLKPELSNVCKPSSSGFLASMNVPFAVRTSAQAEGTREEHKKETKRMRMNLKNLRSWQHQTMEKPNKWGTKRESL